MTDQRTQLETELKDTQIANAKKAAPEPKPRYYTISHEELSKLAVEQQRAIGVLRLHSKKHPVSRDVAIGALGNLLVALREAKFEEAKVTKKRVNLPPPDRSALEPPDALPYACPRCGGTGTIECMGHQGGMTAIPCGLCEGVGRLAREVVENV